MPAPLTQFRSPWISPTHWLHSVLVHHNTSVLWRCSRSLWGVWRRILMSAIDASSIPICWALLWSSWKLGRKDDLEYETGMVGLDFWLLVCILTTPWLESLYEESPCLDKRIVWLFMYYATMIYEYPTNLACIEYGCCGRKLKIYEPLASLCLWLSLYFVPGISIAI